MKLKLMIFIDISVMMLKQDSIPATSIKITHLVYQPVKIKIKLIGMMQDEAAGKIITEFAALRAKLYSYRMDVEDYIKCEGL